MKTLEPYLSPDDVCEILVDGSTAIIRTIAGTILSWTAGAERMYGWEKDEAIGHAWEALSKPVLPQLLSHINEQLLRNGHWSGQIVRQTKHGRTIIVQSSWKLLSGKNGERNYVVEENIDVTELA